MAWVHSVGIKAVFVFLMRRSSLGVVGVSLPCQRHGRDVLDFCNLSACEQLDLCPTHIAGNRLDLVMTDSPDILDVFVDAPLGTSDQCFVSCVIGVEQSVPEYNCLQQSFEFCNRMSDIIYVYVWECRWIRWCSKTAWRNKRGVDLKDTILHNGIID